MRILLLLQNLQKLNLFKIKESRGEPSSGLHTSITAPIKKSEDFNSVFHLFKE